MTKKLTAFILAILVGLAQGKPPEARARIEKIEGTVVELPENPAQSFDAVRISVTFTSNPDGTKELYSTISRKTEYSVQNLKRPKLDEAVLVLPKGCLPAGTKIGDKIRIKDYIIGSIGGSGISTEAPPTPLYVEKVEINPKD